MAERVKNFLTALMLITILLTLQTCSSDKTESDLSGESIIPRPVKVISTGDFFTLKTGTVIYVQNGSPELTRIGEYLAEVLRPSTGFQLPVRPTGKEPRIGAIYLTLAGPDTDTGEEGYELIITRKLVRLTANNPAGIFRGVQTIRQILPPAVEMKTKQEGLWNIPSGTIVDFPYYSYRGAMLDVSRHFFGVEDVKRFADFLAYYKMNILHLHLSDDQGWRIEIRSWPNLAKYGGSTQVGGSKGGYYTQEEYAEIVQYARERYIDIVPEIDMPGHTNAALASYPELNCDGVGRELYTGTQVGFSTLCTSKEITYKFVDDVVREIAALTPGKWFHIGGDESHVTKIDDYIQFINRVQDIVLSHGKKVIGWDEIALSELRPGSVAQHWADVENAQKAIGQGAKILMSPARKAYLDMKYDKSTKLGLRWAGLIEVDTGYDWDPATIIPGIVKENIIGIESPLWSETVTNMEDIEFMVFPRLPGYAEIGWTPSLLRSWDEYKIRLARHGERFEAMGINFYRSPLVPWTDN
jgi:hexosaminidase